jgi:hypothetical protein
MSRASLDASGWFGAMKAAGSLQPGFLRGHGDDNVLEITQALLHWTGFNFHRGSSRALLAVDGEKFTGDGWHV